MTKLIQHDKSHVVWVLPCHHITHGCMAKPMYVMHWHIHGFYHAQTKYYSAFGNLTLIVMWSCLTMSNNENFISHLHHNHRFLFLGFVSSFLRAQVDSSHCSVLGGVALYFPVPPTSVISLCWASFCKLLCRFWKSLFQEENALWSPGKPPKKRESVF